MSDAIAEFELHNLRDLGGIPTPGGAIRSGRVFRSANPDALSAEGWQELVALGIRTVVDLRNDDELEQSQSGNRPNSVSVLRRPVEDRSDAQFMAEWGSRLSTPAYYPEILTRWPALIADAVAAVADAPAGAVLMHCASGQDRTGMLAAILLELVDVDRAAIRDNYAAGVRGNNEWWRVHGEPGDAMSDDQLAARLTDILPTLDAFLDGVTMETYLRGAGVTPEQLARIRSRLLSD